MNKDPRTLKDLVDNANEGYSMSVFGETKFSEDDIYRVKAGGFKKTKENVYKWWANGSWILASKAMKRISELFIIDGAGFKAVTGETLTAEIARRSRIPQPSAVASARYNSTKWTKGVAAEFRNEVKVYKQVSKKNHAQVLYEKLSNMIEDTYQAPMIVPEFTTGTISSICDLIAVNDKDIEAFEIKSKADTLKRLRKQVSDYKIYADKVWVVIDKKLTDKLYDWMEDNPDISPGVGIIIYDGDHMNVVREAEKNIVQTNYLDMLWSIEKEKILYGLGLSTSATTVEGTRDQRISSVCLNADHRISSISKTVLLSRLRNFARGRHPSSPKYSVNDCAGTISLTLLQVVVYGEPVLDGEMKSSGGCSIQ